MGIVCDCFSYYGLLGTMPCYHDNITENAWNYGNKLLNLSSDELDEIRKAKKQINDDKKIIKRI